MERFFDKLTDEDLLVVRDMITQAIENRKEIKRIKEEPKPKDAYAEMLYKLYLKGMIDETQLEQKLNERKK